MDRLITSISPTWGLRRARARAALQVMASAGFTPDSAYNSATTNLRSLATWLPGRSSAMGELTDATRNQQIARSSDSYKNNAIATAVIKRNKTCVVGTGLRLQSRIDYRTLGITREQASEKQREIETLFRVWAESPDECDLERSLDFYSLQATILVSSLVSGDLFCLTPVIRYPGRSFSLKLQAIEADRVSNPHSTFDTKKCKGGIDLGANGEPVGVWIMEDHPNEFCEGSHPYRWRRHAVFGPRTGRRRVLQIFEKDRPQAYRGCVYLSPVMETLKQISRYKDSELMAALIASFFTVFIKSTKPVSPYGGAPSSVLTASTYGVETNANASDEYALGEGLINVMGPDQDIQIADPHRPNKDAAGFIDLQLREIGSALEIPFEILTQRFQSSYSAARAALIEAWRYFLVRRAQLRLQLCQPSYELFFDEVVASGVYSAPGYSDPLKRAAWTRASWVGPSRGSIDELKAAKSSTERMNNGTSNEAIECDEMARDRDEVFAQRAYEMQTRRDAGMDTNYDATQTNSSVPDEYAVATRD